MAEIARICDVYCAADPERPYGSAASARWPWMRSRARSGVRLSNSLVDQFAQCIGLSGRHAG